MVAFHFRGHALLSLLTTASIVTNSFTLTSGHGVEVRQCLTQDGKLRFFVEHWHGALTSPSQAGTMTIGQSIDGAAETRLRKHAGGMINGLFSLSQTGWGCKNDEAPAIVTTCNNSKGNWVYYEHDGTCNVPVQYRLLSGNTVYLEEGCTSLYPATIATTFSDTAPPVPKVVIGSTAYNLPYTPSSSYVANAAGQALVSFNAVATDDCDANPIIDTTGDFEVDGF